MPETVQALLITVLAVLPGAVATFSFERHVGTYAAEFPERVVRFIVGSALVFPLTAAFAWPFWRHVLHVARVNPSTGATRFVNLVGTNGDVSPLWLLVPLGYVVAPAVAGNAAGWMWARRLREHEQVPRDDLRAWDWLFLDPRPKIIVARLRSGRWVAGLFGEESHASPKDFASKDLYLEVAYEVDDDGVLKLDNTDFPVQRDVSLLLHGDDVEFFEVIRHEG
jgi:hypothetical protein